MHHDDDDEGTYLSHCVVIIIKRGIIFLSCNFKHRQSLEYLKTFEDVCNIESEK